MSSAKPDRSAPGGQGAPPRTVSDPGTACPGIQSLELCTARSVLDPMRRFYADQMRLPLVQSEREAFAVRAGGTTIRFHADHDAAPYYHFAFNIPENKLAAAKEWLRPVAAPLKKPDGGDVYDFVSWNAHSIYFVDPAGNILEFIARHNLKNAAAGPFGPADILYASEIGLVVDDVAQAVAAVRAGLGLELFTGVMSDDFAALGDDHRLLIIVKTGRVWNALDKHAAAFPTAAQLYGDRAGDLRLPGKPYDIRLRPA